jgi:negative regulator of replication initiation
MHRAQVLLQDELYERLEARARGLGMSTSELIRGLLEQGIEKNSAADARAFFERLDPLESFAGVEPETYVRQLRSTSRLLRPDHDGA